MTNVRKRNRSNPYDVTMFKALIKGYAEESQKIRRKRKKAGKRSQMIRERDYVYDGYSWMKKRSDGTDCYWYDRSELWNNKKQRLGYRSRHLQLARAYLLGIPYKALEQKCREDNEPDEATIVTYVEELSTYGTVKWETTASRKKYLGDEKREHVRAWLKGTTVELEEERASEEKKKQEEAFAQREAERIKKSGIAARVKALLS